MIVSLALLGFGASGTTLTIFPRWLRRHPQHHLFGLSMASGLSMLGAYVLSNQVPFDSFTIAWDPWQVAILALHYVALATPFFFSGLVVGLLLTAYPQVAGQTYAVNLVGSALGCVVALYASSIFGGEGTVAFSSGLAALAALTVFPVKLLNTSRLAKAAYPILGLLAVTLLVGNTYLMRMYAGDGTKNSFLDLHISPYKSISYALQYPGSQLIFHEWNALSRVDVVSSPGIRSLPGLSYRYPGLPPQENGLLVDGDDLNPLLLPEASLSFSDHMPSAIAFQLRPGAETLVLEPRGGADILIAHSLGASEVTAVEPNPLILSAAAHIYTLPNTLVVTEAPRSFMHQTSQTFDIIVFALSNNYRPVNSGAYSLGEDYRYTVESFQSALDRLKPDGLLVVNRWLQLPPSEWLRTFALAVTALEASGLEPEGRIVAFRGFNLGTLLVKRTPFTTDELEAVREFAASRAFDMVYAPDIRPEETNRFNVLDEPSYYQAFTGLLNSPSPADWYAAYPFDVNPPKDDRPFFGHFFKWSQTPQVLATLGKTWQPFGGAGYFVVLVLLGLALILVCCLILLPLALVGGASTTQSSPSKAPRHLRLYVVTYFGLLGLAFLLIEIPLIQHFILFLGHPVYALTAVLFTLLLFSGLGSHFAHQLPQRASLTLLIAFILFTPWLLPFVFKLSLGMSLARRLAITLILLAPIGFLMGTPFPQGIRGLQGKFPHLIPWAWGVNGATSVVAAVLSALLSLSFGLRAVLLFGAACYLGVWLIAPRLMAQQAGRPH